MGKLTAPEHKLLAEWAADCAEHVLFLYEDHHPGDDRPRKAIEAARAWAHGKMKVSEARNLALAAHTAARDARFAESVAAARSAGHAAATAHVARHSEYAALYAAKAAGDPKEETEWQTKKLPFRPDW